MAERMGEESKGERRIEHDAERLVVRLERDEERTDKHQERDLAHTERDMERDVRRTEHDLEGTGARAERRVERDLEHTARDLERDTSHQARDLDKDLKREARDAEHGGARIVRDVEQESTARMGDEHSMHVNVRNSFEPTEVKAGMTGFGGNSWVDASGSYQQEYEQKFGEQARWADVEQDYHFAHEMRSDERFKGRSFEESEPELREGHTTWRQREGRAVEDVEQHWDKAKEHIRHVWHRGE